MRQPFALALSLLLSGCGTDDPPAEATVVDASVPDTRPDDGDDESEASEEAGLDDPALDAGPEDAGAEEGGLQEPRPDVPARETTPDGGADATAASDGASDGASDAAPDRRAPEDAEPGAEPDGPEPEEGEPVDFPPVEDFGEPGPFPVVTAYDVGPDRAFALFYPDPPGAGGRLHPVLTWGNGTLLVPRVYAALLSHLASHGFIVVASNSMNTGSGREMVQGARWVVEQSGDADSVFHGAVDADAVGATGHSQGGGGAINAGADPLVWLTAPLQPWLGFDPGPLAALHGPMFVVAGELDFIVPAASVTRLVYEPSEVETVYGTLRGAGHLEPISDNVANIRRVVTAWFRAHLMGDLEAAALFYDECQLCDDERWFVQRKNLGAP